MIRSIITLLILFIAAFQLPAQKLMVPGEYQVGIVDSGKVYTTVGSDAGYSTVLVTGLNSIAKGSGAQYTTCYLDSAGGFHVLNGGTTTFNSYNLKANNTAISFTDILGHWRSYIGIAENKVWYLPLLNDELGQVSNDTSNKWIELTQPGGSRVPVKIVSGANTDFALSYLLALYDDGTVWEWRRTTPSQTTTPTQLTWSGGNTNAIDIAQVGGIASVIITPDGVFTKGYYASVIGGTILTQNSAFENVTSSFSGPVRPWKQVATTYYSLHIRDANDDLWAIGCNQQGVFGNGYQYPSWRTYWYAGNPSPYRFSWANGEGYQNMTQIMGAKVSNIVTHNAIAPYIYVQDLAGKWYSSGRNKAPALQNGVRMLVDDEANFSEFYNIPGFRNIYPRTQTWTVMSAVDTAALRAPIANAGIDQYINTSTTTLYGNASHQQQPGQSTTVTMSYAWTKVSGPSCTITSPSSQSTTVTGLSSGTYVFRNTVTSSHGSDYDEVLVQVDLPVSHVYDFDTTINSWNAIVHLPDTYYSGVDSFPMIVFFPGLGEVGTDIEDLRANGPHKYIENGDWNGNSVVDGDTVKFIVVSIQPPSSYPNTSTIDTRIQTLLSTYRANKLHLTGLSHGSWCASTYVADYPNVTSVVNVQGVQPFNTVDYVTEFTPFVNAGGKYLGIEQVSDFRDISNLISALNSIQTGSGIYVQTNYGGGGHCCWGEFYGDSDAPQNLYNSENIYQWMARLSIDDEELPTPPAPNPGAVFDACQCFPSNSVLY